MERVKLAEEVWQDRDGNPVPFGSVAGVSVLYGAGAQVSAEEAARLAQALKALDAPPANKAVSKAPKTK